MVKFFRNKKELVFWIVGIIVFGLLLIYIIYSFRFLTKAVGQIFNGLIKPAEIVKFNLDKAGQLKR